jgi:5-methylcytosine-specific restriction endonuclease McrA
MIDADMWAEESERMTDLERTLNRSVAEVLAYHAGIRRGTELAKMPYNEYLQSPEWQGLRRLAITKAGGRCQRCGEYRGLQVHHLTYERRGWEQIQDVEAVCSRCHRQEHGRP